MSYGHEGDLLFVLSDAGDPETSDIREWLVKVNRLHPSAFDIPERPYESWSLEPRESPFLQRYKRMWRKRFLEACRCPTEEKVPLVLDYLKSAAVWEQEVLRKEDLDLAREYLKSHRDVALSMVRAGPDRSSHGRYSQAFFETVFRIGHKEDREWVLERARLDSFDRTNMIHAMFSENTETGLRFLKELADKNPEWDESLYIRTRMGDAEARKPLLRKVHRYSRSADDGTVPPVFPSVSEDALRLIARTKDPAFCEPLREMLRPYREDDGQPYVELATTLAALGDTEGVKKSVQLLENEEAFLWHRLRALEALRENPKTARDQLRVIEKAALSDDPYLSKAAIEALQEHGDRQTLEFLYRMPLWCRGPITEKAISLLEEKYPDAAREKPDKDAPPPKRLYFDGPLQPTKAFSDRVNELFRRLERELAEDKGPDSRHSVNVYRLALNMAYLANPETVEPLVKLFNMVPAPRCVIRTRSYNTHDAVSAALRKIGPPAIEPLIRMYKDGNETQQLSAISVLGYIKADDPRIPEILSSTLSDKGYHVPWEAVRALRWRKDPLIIPHALELLRRDDSNLLMKDDCITALRDIGSDAAVHQMVAGSRDPGVTIQTKIYLVQALGTMENEKALATLQELTESPDAELRKAANEALAKRSRKQKKTENK